jgi:hypothetical protein
MQVKRRPKVRLVPFVLLMAGAALPGAILPKAGLALANEGRLTDCRMKYDLKGWSVFYKTAKGSGVITCDNGQSMKVRLEAKGGGISFGKSEIIGGTGRFTEVRGIEELLGSYVQSEAHAGAGKSADAQALTKGEVSLSLAGTGRGVDVGFAFGKFTIQRAR